MFHPIKNTLVAPTISLKFVAVTPSSVFHAPLGVVVGTSIPVDTLTLALTLRYEKTLFEACVLISNFDPKLIFGSCTSRLTQT